MGNCVGTPAVTPDGTPGATTPQSAREKLQSVFSSNKQEAAGPLKPCTHARADKPAGIFHKLVSTLSGHASGVPSTVRSLDVRDVKGLNFASPELFRPHGLAGSLSILLGFYFTIQTLLGYHARPSAPSGFVTFYAVISVIACFGALGLIKKAPSSIRLFFQMGALLQIGMLYFCYRFDSFPVLVHPSVPGIVSHGIDIIMAGLMTSTVLVLLKNTIQDRSSAYSSKALKAATCCGIAAIGSLCGYPVQLAVMGAPWLENVYRWYPLQQVAFPYYVYIPATLGFNVIFFSATLHLRKLVSTKTFVRIILAFVFGTLVPTVVLQEVYIPRVSTQKLLIFRGPVASTWWPRLEL